MDSRAAQAFKCVAKKSWPVFLALFAAVILAVVSAKVSHFGVEDAGSLGGFAWFVAGVFLRFIYDEREDVYDGVPALFFGMATVLFFTSRSRPLFQMSGYFAGTIFALFAVAMVVFAVEVEGYKAR